MKAVTAVEEAFYARLGRELAGLVPLCRGLAEVWRDGAEEEAEEAAAASKTY